MIFGETGKDEIILSLYKIIVHSQQIYLELYSVEQHCLQIFYLSHINLIQFTLNLTKIK